MIRAWVVSLCSATVLGLLIYADVALLESEGRGAPRLSQLHLSDDWAAGFAASVEQTTGALAQIELPLPAPREERRGSGSLRWTLRRYEVTVPAPEAPGAIEALFAPVHAAVPNATVSVTEDAVGAQVHIGVDGLLTHTVALRWLGRRPRAALVVDNLGNDLRPVGELGELDVPLAFAVVPGRPFAREVAARAALLGREVVVQLSMGSDMGDAETALRWAGTRDEVRATVGDALAAVPHAVGVTHRGGERLSADRERMRWVLERVGEAGLFYIDSRTTERSVVCEVAAAVPVPCAERGVRLDDPDDVGGTAASVGRHLPVLLTLARTRGDVIAVTAVRPDTAEALRAALREIASADIDVVPLSVLTHDATAGARSAAVAR